MPTPIKRHSSIQPLSREHHHDLLLCWKIRTGFKKGISITRIKKYVDWFYQSYMISHFEAEENHLFPILGSDHAMIKKAMSQHKRLKRLILDEKDPVKSISLLEEELEQHVRFEERILFNEIQRVATEKQLLEIAQALHEGEFEDNLEDEFWK